MGQIAPGLMDNMSTDTPSMSEQPEATGPQTVKWVVVKRTPGITVAEIYVGRLQSEGIPARAWQEGAGEAYGLTVGLLGTGHVVVPEEYAEEAQAVLAAAEAGYEADEEE